MIKQEGEKCKQAHLIESGVRQRENAPAYMRHFLKHIYQRPTANPQTPSLQLRHSEISRGWTKRPT
ncbi:MAG TPA: hypothetical protein DEB40_14045 [Elusimicrobia bacterium]|nr:hypothetical protein [Elusimicrobiota bacterium]HBT62853.1 hypothetical protein [Elusimicrobiota bacterium]